MNVSLRRFSALTSKPKACRISASDSRHAATSIVSVVLGMISVFMVLQSCSFWKHRLPEDLNLRFRADREW